MDAEQTVLFKNTIATRRLTRTHGTWISSWSGISSRSLFHSAVSIVASMKFSYLRSRHLLLGYIGELLARWYLRRKGFRLETARYRNKYGEIDIIAWDGLELCFVEVKTRFNTERRPIERVDRHKRQILIRTAKHYIEKKNLALAPSRFDVVEIQVKSLTCISFTLHRNAFRDDDRYQ